MAIPPTDLDRSVPSRRPAFYRSRGFHALLSCAVLTVLFSQLHWREVAQFLQRANGWWLCVLVLVYTADRVVMGLKWWLLIRDRNTGLSPAAAVRIYFISSLFGLALPVGSLGPDVVRVAMLRTHGVATDLGVSSILVERFIGLIATLLLVALSLVLALFLLAGSGVDEGLVSALVVVAVGVGVLLPVMLGAPVPGVAALRNLAGRLFKRVGLERHWLAIDGFRARRTLLAIGLALAWLEQWLPVLAFYIACLAFGVSLGFWQCLAIVPVTSILMRLPISFGGLGVREVGIVYMAGLFGVAYADALLVSVSQFVVFVVSLLPGAIWYLAGGAVVVAPEDSVR